MFGPAALCGIGAGLVFVPTMLMSFSEVPGQESGVACSMLKTEQAGGALGLSVLTAVFATATRTEQQRQTAHFLVIASRYQAQRFADTGRLPPVYASRVLTHGIAHAFAASSAVAGFDGTWVLDS